MSYLEKFDDVELQKPLLERNKNLSSNDLNEQNSQQKWLRKPKIDRTRRRTAEDYNEAAKFLAVTGSEKDVPLSKYSDSNLLKGEHNNSKRSNMSHKIHTRKLSQSRGVKLPAIHITDIKKNSISSTPHTAPASTSDQRSPTLTSSPIGHTLIYSKVEPGLSESFIHHVPDSIEDIDIRIFFSNGKAVQFTVEGGREAQASDLLQLMADYLDINYDVASETFALWLISPLLEVQLKPHHVAYEAHSKWRSILRKFTSAREEEILEDEPLLVMKRNVQLNIESEINFQEEYERLTEVLYWDAKDEYMTGRYLVDIQTAVSLAALQMAIEFGPYEMNSMPEENNEDVIEIIRTKITELVPDVHVNTVRSFHLFGIPVMECKKGWEHELVEEYKTASMVYPNNYQRRIAYLDILRATPFYGSAFFHGTTDRRGALSLLNLGRKLFSLSSRMDVLIGINYEFITVADSHKHECLLVQRIADCSWMKIIPEQIDEALQIPSFLLHFPDSTANLKESPKVTYSSENVVIHHGTPTNEELVTTPVSRLLQIFSKQSVMMEALLNALYEISISEMASDEENDEAAQFSGEESLPAHETSMPESTVTLPTLPSSNQSIQGSTMNYYDRKPKNGSTTSSNSSLNNNNFGAKSYNHPTHSTVMQSYFTNKLSRLCLATLDPNGNCVEAHGTLRKMLLEVH